MAQAINLQIAPSNVMPKIYASQFDIGREIEISLYDGASAYMPPVGTDIRFEGKKPDGNGFSYECTYTGNVVTIVTTDQMTVLAGEIPCELRMSLNGNDIGTLNIIFVIEKSPIDENVPISDTEIPAIIELARDEQYTAEAWAIGERNGVPVGPEDPQYHNNAKYWAEHAEYGALDDLTDVEITTPTNGQVVTYNGTSQKWENKDIPSDTVTQAIIAPVEGATSLHAYVVGEQLIYNDTLYKVIAPISVNDALVIDTNIEVSPKTVIEQVEDNASEIDDVWSTMAKNGAHQFLYNRVTSVQVVGGLTITPNANGSFTVGAGTATSTAQLLVSGTGTGSWSQAEQKLPIGEYYATCEGGTAGIYLKVMVEENNQQKTVYGSGQESYVVSSAPSNLIALIQVISGTVIPTGGITLKPLLRLQSDSSKEIAPYTKTNRELTENDAVETAYFDIPSSYHAGTSGRIIFEKRNGVVRAFWSGGSPLFPQQGTQYELGDIPVGFTPNNDTLIFGVDMTSFTKGLYLNFTKQRKVKAMGYNTGTNGSVNNAPSVTYITSD